VSEETQDAMRNEIRHRFIDEGLVEEPVRKSSKTIYDGSTIIESDFIVCLATEEATRAYSTT
jgi:hypothetical protein